MLISFVTGECTWLRLVARSESNCEYAQLHPHSHSCIHSRSPSLFPVPKSLPSVHLQPQSLSVYFLCCTILRHQRRHILMPRISPQYLNSPIAAHHNQSNQLENNHTTQQQQRHAARQRLSTTVIQRSPGTLAAAMQRCRSGTKRSRGAQRNAKFQSYSALE